MPANQPEEKKEKRKGGQLAKNGEWLVLTESTGQERVGYTHNCGEIVRAAQVAHPIWDSPFPCSGSGRCQYETVPYCPKCEEKPDYHGSPIRMN